MMTKINNADNDDADDDNQSDDVRWWCIMAYDDDGNYVGWW